MGIPGLDITEEMVPEMQGILESAGIKVEKETHPDEYLKLPPTHNGKQVTLKMPNFCLRCENEEGYHVTLRFSRFSMEPYSLAVAIMPHPRTSFWKSIIKPDKNKLVDEIIAVLKEHGAQEFDVLNDEKAE